jgi:hypothetical protein
VRGAGKGRHVHTDLADHPDRAAARYPGMVCTRSMSGYRSATRMVICLSSRAIWVVQEVRMSQDLGDQNPVVIDAEVPAKRIDQL